MSSEIIQNPFYHYTYVFDKNTGDLEYPDIYLLTKSLHKKGQLYPVSGLKIVVKANDTDEISFDFYKYLDNIEQELYDQLKTDSVVYVKGFGCFQLKVSEYDKEEGICKSVSGESLANTELANILATLEINTENDILVSDYENENVTDYIPTVFYRDPEKYDKYSWTTANDKLSVEEKKQKLKDSSLFHRILSYAPHYEIGHVDESLYYVQRTFSWNNTFIQDIFKEVGEEVGCIFTFETYLDDNGKTVRKVNAYDISYCTKCFENAAMQLSYKTFDTSKFRSITNGVCDNCNSSEYVYDYGKDTDIFITTENLTDSITLQPENEIKNVFKISGGDDDITSAVQALNMGSSKLMMFSEETKNEMSDELRKKFEDYIKDQSSISSTYETLVETQSNVYDLIQYLQSGKMPQLADNARDIQEEVKYLLSSITTDYKNNFYIESYNKGEKCFSGHELTVSASSIKNLFTLYLDKGYSVRVSNGDIGDKENETDTYIRWNGIITVYETSNSDNYAEIHCSKTDTTYVEYNQITAENSDTKLQETYSDFYVNLMFADQDPTRYAAYIKQFCEQKLAAYKKVEYKNEEEKPWKEYCYERLKSFRDGYQACLESLNEMASQQQMIGAVKQILLDMYNSYSFIQHKISEQMKILEKQINALYRYLGEYTYETDKYGKRTYSPDYVSEDYTVDYKKEIFSIAYSLPSTKYFIGTKPIACKKCGSSNVGIAKNESGTEYNYCLSCGNTDPSLLVTYADIAKQVSEQCNKSENNLLKDITEIRNKFKIENYFGELYNELLPYIKEQEYSNSNYTSDACNTNQDIIAKAKELLQKSRKELYKACEQQYSVSADVFSLLAERWKNWDENTKYHDMYDKFSLGNWMRVRLDKTIKKLRLISITFDFDTVDKMSVEFSDVIQVGNVLSDINSVLQQASAISSTYNYVTDQAKQGSEANVEINKILQNGLDSAYSAVMAGDNQEITMDRHGLLFRKFLDELDDYSKYQMKMINRNIVMTDDGWKSARLAIGLGMLPDGTYGYGIWADNIIGGQITCTNNMKIIGGKNSVIIDGDGIRFDKGVIDSSAVSGLDDSLKDFVKSLGDLQNQIDGEITSWFEEYDPTVDNEPASTWKTDEDKIKHEGDLFYNTATGRAFRYIYNSSAKNHEWSIVTDEAISKALADAATAKDTADRKRRVFVVTPYVPYDVGDLWAQGDKGDLYKCKIAKTEKETCDVAADWEKATKYTDDTKAKEVENNLAKFQSDVSSCLGTEITEKAVISPKIGGGYLYIAKKNGCSVEIDPLGLKNGNVLRIANKNDEGIMSVDNNGNGTFKGKIEADSGNIGGWEISPNYLSTKNNAAIYQYELGKDGSPGMSIIGGKAIFSKYSVSLGTLDGSLGYTDISYKGIYARPIIKTATDYMFKVDTTKQDVLIDLTQNQSSGYGNFNLYAKKGNIDFKSEGNINFGCDSNNNPSLWIGTKEMRIGRDAPSNNYFYIDSQNFQYWWKDASGSTTLNHSINDDNVGFCRSGYGSLMYKGSEVVNQYYGLNNYQPKSSSDLRLKKEITSLNNVSQVYLSFKPKLYKFKDTKYENNEKIHTGLIAQQVINTLADNGVDWKDTDLVEEYKCRDYMDEGQYTGETAYRINYENLHAYHIAFSQEMHQEIQQLKDENKKKDEKISELEKRLEKLESIISSIA